MTLNKIFAIFYKDLLNESSYRFAFITQFLGMLFAALSFFFLSRMLGDTALPSLAPYGGDYFSFVLIGVAFATYLRVSLESFSQFIRNSQLTGTLEALLLTQTPIALTILSSSLYNFFMASIRVVSFLLIGAMFLGLQLSGANYLGAFILMVMTIGCFSCFGIISASFIMVLKKGDPLNWLFIHMSWLLGGVYYPVTVLPEWAQNLSRLLPLTHSLEGMRFALLKGYNVKQLVPFMLPLAIISLVLIPVSLLSLGYAINKARESGSLTHY